MPLTTGRSAPPTKSPQRFDRQAMLDAGMTTAMADALLKPKACAARPATASGTWATLAAQRFAPFAARARALGLTTGQTEALRALQTPAQIDAALTRWEAAK